MTDKITIIPSGRIDWCGACKAEHGYDCPKDQKPSWQTEFDAKCSESFAKGGFLTTDLVGDWALDKQPIKSFIASQIEKAREEANKVTQQKLDEVVDMAILGERARVKEIIEKMDAIQESISNTINEEDEQYYESGYQDAKDQLLAAITPPNEE